MPRLPADFDVAAVQFVEGLLEELQGQGLCLALANPSHQVGTAWWQVVVALETAQDAHGWPSQEGGGAAAKVPPGCNCQRQFCLAQTALRSCCLAPSQLLTELTV